MNKIPRIFLITFMYTNILICDKNLSICRSHNFFFFFFEELKKEKGNLLEGNEKRKNISSIGGLKGSPRKPTFVGPFVS